MLYIIRITANLLKRLQMHFDFMNIILLRSDNRHVSATPVAVFSVIRARIPMYLCVRITPLLKIIQCCWHVFHRAKCIIAHHPGSKSTPCTSYVHHCTEPHSTIINFEHFVLIAVYRLTDFFTKIMWF